MIVKLDFKHIVEVLITLVKIVNFTALDFYIFQNILAYVWTDKLFKRQLRAFELKYNLSSYDSILYIFTFIQNGKFSNCKE